MSNSVPQLSKREPFDGKHFRHWQQKLMFVLETINMSYVLTELKPSENDEQHELTNTGVSEAWNKANRL